MVVEYSVSCRRFFEKKIGNIRTNNVGISNNTTKFVFLWLKIQSFLCHYYKHRLNRFLKL